MYYRTSKIFHFFFHQYLTRLLPPTPPEPSSTTNAVSDNINTKTKIIVNVNSTKRVPPDGENSANEQFKKPSKRHIVKPSTISPTDEMEITDTSDPVGNEVLLNDSTVQQAAPKTRKPPPIYIEARYDWHTNLSILKGLAPSHKKQQYSNIKFP